MRGSAHPPGEARRARAATIFLARTRDRLAKFSWPESSWAPDPEQTGEAWRQVEQVMFHPRSRNDQGDYRRQADMVPAQRLVYLRHDAGNLPQANRETMKTNSSLFRRLLASKYSNGLSVEPIRLVKRGRDTDDSKLTKLRESSYEVKDDALLCRGIEMQAVYHRNVEDIRGREPMVDRRLQIVGCIIATGRA